MCALSYLNCNIASEKACVCVCLSEDNLNLFVLAGDQRDLDMKSFSLKDIKFYKIYLPSII